MSTICFTLDLDIHHRDRYSQRNSSRVLPWVCSSLSIAPPLLILKVATLVEGNEVGGSFYLNDTDAIAADASAEEMEILLEATDLGDVNVTRSETKYGRVHRYSGWKLTRIGLRYCAERYLQLVYNNGVAMSALSMCDSDRYGSCAS